MTVDITAVITGHREGLMAGASLTTFRAAIDRAESSGLTVETVVMLDRPDTDTAAVLGAARDWGAEVVELDLGDQGRVRNHASEAAAGRYVAFLDADDHWSENWLVEAHQTCHEGGDGVIAHPEVNWFFGGFNHVFFHADVRDPGFDPAHLRHANYWDALCLAPRAAYVDHPYASRDVAGGFAYEDWHWNMETLAAGYAHHVARGTLHFKRRREGSQTVQASAAQVLTRMSPLLDFAWPGYARRDR